MHRWIERHVRRGGVGGADALFALAGLGTLWLTTGTQGRALTTEAASLVEATSTMEALEHGALLLSLSAATSTSVIGLRQTTASVTGPGASVDEEIVTIASGGEYTIRGALSDGRVIVDADDDDNVTLILDGASIRCSNSSPIDGINADQVVIVLQAGTDNYVEDGSDYVFDDRAKGEPDAAIFSADDLTIEGDGSLTVVGNYNHGIHCKNDLRISGGDLGVTAVNDGIKGRDSITIRSASVRIDAGGDGLQSNNNVDAGQVTVTVTSGTLDIDAGADGIQATATLAVEGGTLSLVTGGGSANCSTVSGDPRRINDAWGMWGPGGTTSAAADTPSAKGLKAGTSLTISGGTITIDSSDDSIHSNGTIRIEDGVITASSGDDGIHGDTSVQILGGDITIDKSYEALESMAITLDGGTLRLVASDDGINAADGNDTSALGGRPGKNPFAASASCSLTIHGGCVFVDARRRSRHQRPDHHDRRFRDRQRSHRQCQRRDRLHGVVPALGRIPHGRRELRHGRGTEQLVVAELRDGQPHVVPIGRTLVHIEEADGDEVVTFLPTKAYQSVLFSSSELRTGTTYDVYTGGRATTASEDGVYTNGGYSPRTEVGSFTISSSVTVIGSGGMWGQPGGRFR